MFLFRPPRLKTVTTLPCEIRKPYTAAVYNSTTMSAMPLTQRVHNVVTKHATSCVKALFEVTSLCTNTGIDAFFATDQLLRQVRLLYVYTQLEASRGAHHLLLQLCHILHWRMVDSFLHPYSNAVISRLMSGLFGRVHISGAMNLVFLRRNISTVLTSTMSSALSC